MRVRFKGEADGLPCHVFGQGFPAGVWVDVEGVAAAKLPGNPAFDSDGEVADGEVALSVEQLHAELDAREIAYHPRAGQAKLAALLAEASTSPTEREPEPEPEPDPEETEA